MQNLRDPATAHAAGQGNSESNRLPPRSPLPAPPPPLPQTAREAERVKRLAAALKVAKARHYEAERAAGHVQLEIRICTQTVEENRDRLRGARARERLVAKDLRQAERELARRRQAARLAGIDVAAVEAGK